MSKIEEPNFSKEELKAQKKYDKSASKEAGKYNSRWENLTGTGTGKVKKEDIIRADANFENDVRTWSSKEKDLIEKVCNSTELSTQTNKIEHDVNALQLLAGASPRHYEQVLKGDIDGQKIEITANRRDPDMSRGEIRTSGEVEFRNFRGTINGKELSEKEAEKFFNLYVHFAEERMQYQKDEIEKEREDVLKSFNDKK